METSSCCKFVAGHQIATNFCTCHDSTAVVPCTKFCSDLCIRLEMRVKRNFHRIWNAMEKPLVKRCPGPCFNIYMYHLTIIGNSIVEIQRVQDRLVSTMGFLIMVIWHLYIESSPSIHRLPDSHNLPTYCDSTVHHRTRPLLFGHVRNCWLRLLFMVISTDALAGNKISLVLQIYQYTPAYVTAHM